MVNEDIINWFEVQAAMNEHITFPNDILDILDKETAQAIVENYAHNTFMKLPDKEIKFFEWLKENDKEIWDDLWDSEDEEYIIGVGLLPLLIEKTRGFPICDLETTDNYFFTEHHMIEKEAKMFIETVQQMFMDKKPLTVEQTLVLEISAAPIDIWRFAYRYNLDVDRAKQAVKNLSDERLLIHMKKPEQLANFVEY